MGFDVYTYNPSSVTLTFGGYPLTGWDTISFKKNAPGYTAIRGIRGKNTRVRNKDLSSTITFSCLQTGEANDIMSEIHRLDLNYGTARIALTLKDNSGQTLFSSSEGFIVDFPEVVFSGDFEYRVWTIYCLTTESIRVGGNAEAQSSLFNKVSGFVGDGISALGSMF